LLMVLADGVLVAATPNAIGQYVLQYFVVWRVWSDMHYWLNLTCADDSLQKLYLVWQMCLMVGMAVTARDAMDETGATFAVFYIVSRFSLILMYTLLDWCDTRFRHMLIYYRVCIGLSVIVWLVSAFMTPMVRTILWSCSFVFDMLAFSPAMLSFQKRWLKNDKYVFSVHFEHHTERLGTFVIIVLGEAVFALLYRNDTSMLDLRYMKAALGLVLAFSFHWLYFHVDGGDYVHALKRGGITGLLWSNMHMPLTCAIAAMGGSLKELVSDRSVTFSHDSHEEAEDSVKPLIWIFCISSAFVMAFLAIIGMLHLSSDKPGDVRLAKHVRITIRYLMALLWVVMPLFGMGALGVVVSVTLTSSLVTLLEAWGRVKRRVHPPNRIWRSKTFHPSLTTKPQ